MNCNACRIDQRLTGTEKGIEKDKGRSILKGGWEEINGNEER